MNNNKLKPIQQIQGRVQHYLWGGKQGCIVSQLSTSTNQPFAEIWYGSHKRLPSFLYDTEIPLDIELPFLLKFLSIDKPLSIQIHPNKEIAMKLFQQDPIHYIDPNPKPELCIPLTEFHAFLGYLDEELIKKQMIDNPPVKKVIDWNELTKYAEVVDRFLPGDREFLLIERALYHTISVPIPDAFLRLAALGIYEEYMTDISVPKTLGSIIIPAKQEKTFKTTTFGEKLQDILEK